MRTLLLAFAAIALHAQVAQYGVAANGAALPDPRVTPGSVLTSDLAVICVPGYSKTVRHTSGKLKAKVYKAYGVRNTTAGLAEVDHLIPLSHGGADVFENLWPQRYEPRPGAHDKDVVEEHLLRAICNQSVAIEDAHRCMVTDWTQCSKLYE
ncbi:MAG: hypothetical protein NVS9B2_29460 [Steroidobacteraceae bacterium]